MTVQKIPALTLLQMTRPGFLIITVMACLLGIANAAAHQTHIDGWHAAFSLALALMAHASANVLNDYADALNGADAANTTGIYPFTGGAGLIQRQIVNLPQTQQLYGVLAAVLMVGGIWLAARTTPELFVLGFIGLFLAWAYSAPPLALMCRGLGEATVAVCWTLVCVGADMVQRQHFALDMFFPAISLGLLIGNILLINGFPDAPSDAQVGKNTLVVQLGAHAAARVYAWVANGAHAVLWAWIYVKALPLSAAWGLATWPLALWASYALVRHAQTAQQLRPVIVLTIATACLHAGLLAVGLVVALP